MFKFLIVILTLIILQLFVFKFNIKNFIFKIKNYNKLSVLSIKNPNIFNSNHLDDLFLDKTIYSELYQYVNILSKKTDLSDEQILLLNNIITFLNNLLNDILKLYEQYINIDWNDTDYIIHKWDIQSSLEYKFYNENLKDIHLEQAKYYLQILKETFKNEAIINFDKLRQKYKISNYPEFNKIKTKILNDENLSSNLEILHLLNTFEKNFIIPYSNIIETDLKEKADKQVNVIIEFLNNKIDTSTKYLSNSSSSIEGIINQNEEFLKQIKIHY